MKYEKVNIINSIDEQLKQIECSLKWADEFKKESFARKEFKEFRRSINKIKDAMLSRCSVASYGESQVGKSYLMSSLLASENTPFEIEFEGKKYNFVNELNPSGGNLTKIESTGVITRFTTQGDNSRHSERVLVRMLSVADLVMMIVDSYYKDVTINAKESLSSKRINDMLQERQGLWASKNSVLNYISEDDIRDIQDYMLEVIGISANDVTHSDYFDVISANIQYISPDKWSEVFELLWNCNENFNRLFKNLISEYKKISFCSTVYVPFTSVLRKEGTLLQVQWLDLVCGKQPKDVKLSVLTTDVFDENNNLLSQNFEKKFLSALTAEITFILPKEITEQRPFLETMDLLDFPGARNRLDKLEKEIDYVNDMPEILRRGKVAYLFNKYSRNHKISSILFCHHNDQKTANLGNTIKEWVDVEIGGSPQLRAKHLKTLSGIPPLLVVATKFNIDLAKNDNDSPSNLTDHWGRFTNVYPEIFGGDNSWFERWVETETGVEAFKNIFPLRDFKWSGSGAGKSCLFDGYNDGTNGGAKSPETGYTKQEGFENYFDELYTSFASLDFAKRHFRSVEKTWNEVATKGNDGAEPIRNTLMSIAPLLDEARTERFVDQLVKFKEKSLNALSAYFEPEDDEAKSKKTKQIISRVRARLFMSVGSNPEIFGRIIDNLMINPEDFRKIAKDIIVRKVATPKDFSAVNFLRANAGINPEDGKDVNLQKLLDFFAMQTRAELEEEFADKEYTIDDVIDGEQEFCSTVSDIVTKHILEFWIQHLNTSISSLEKYLPYTDDIVLTFQTLVRMLGVKKTISEKISRYDKMFGTNEKLNAIADYASLELNNFISTVGRKYMNEDHIKKISELSAICNIEVDLSPEGIEPARKKQPLFEVLSALDSSSEIMKQTGFNSNDMKTLRRLPLWDNFQRWQNLLLIGIILASGVSTKDPKENAAVKEIIEHVNKLYL